MKEDTQQKAQGQAAAMPQTLFSTIPGAVPGSIRFAFNLLRMGLAEVSDSEEHAAAVEAFDKVCAAYNTLLTAAKLVVMDSANMLGDTVLGTQANQDLENAIAAAGPWTEEEQAKLDSLALGENIPEPPEAP